MIDITALYVEIDDFCKCFLKELKNKLVEEKGIKKRNRQHFMTPGEILTILVYYNYSGMKNFKTYYLTTVTHLLKQYFPKILSYQRYIAILKKYIFLAAILITNDFARCISV